MNRYLLMIILLAVIVLLGETTAQATTPRVHALGGAGDYFEDDSGTLRWYGSLGDYDNAVTLDFGHFNIYQGYHNDQDNTFSGPSLSVRQSLGPRWGMFAATWNAIDDDVPSPSLYRDFREESFSLMYGRRVGTVQLGLVYQKSPEQERREVGLVTQSERQLWGLGARFDVSPRAYVDLAAELRTNREFFQAQYYPYAPPPLDMESDTGINLRVRMFMKLGERTALVPQVEYLREDRPALQRGILEPQKVDGHAFRLGCGLNVFSDTDRFFFVAADWIHGKTDFQYWDFLSDSDWTNDWDALALQVGWERRYWPWMTLRSSAGYRLTRGEGSSPRNAGEGVRGFDYDALHFTLGAGFHLGNWDLDAALSETEPHSVYGDWSWPRKLYEKTWLSVSLRYRIP
jgi:hypothetical protein